MCFCVCVCAHVGAIAASLSIHELRESSKGSWMTHITTGSAQLRWGALVASPHMNLQAVKPIYCIVMLVEPHLETHVEGM